MCLFDHPGWQNSAAIDQFGGQVVTGLLGEALVGGGCLREALSNDLLTDIELPLSWPLIFAGIRAASVFLIATAPLAAIAGGGGLGDIILNQPTYGLAGVIGATIVVVVLAFLVDGLFSLVQRAVTPRGLRLEPELHTILPPTGAEGSAPRERSAAAERA